MNGQLYFTTSPDSGLFVVIATGPEHNETSADVSLIARIVDKHTVIDHDMNNKPLVDALLQVTLPRQKIIVTDTGESVPEAV